MAQPKKKQWSWPTPRTVRTTPQQTAKGSTRYRVNKPDGTYEDFYNQVDADAFITRMLSEHPGYKAVPLEEGQPSTPTPATQQQGAPQQGTVVQPAQPVGNTGSVGGGSGSGSGSGGSSDVPEWARSFNRWTNENIPWLNRGINAFGNFVNDEILLNKNNIRVRNAQNNPEVMNAIQEGGNLAGSIIAAPFLAYGAAEAAPLLWNGLRWGANTFGRALLPSEWAKGLAFHFPKFAPQLETAGQLGNVTLGSILAGPGLNETYQGLKEGDTSRALWGASQTAMSIPFFQEARPLATLMNGTRAYTGSAPSFREALAFSPTSRQVAGTTAMTMPFVAAANTPTHQRNEAGELVLDEQGNPIPVDNGTWYGNLWNWARENPADAAILAYGSYLGGRGLYNRTMRQPRRYSVTEGGNTVKRDRPVGQRPGAAPEYQPVDKLPQEAIPAELVAPEQPSIPNRPMPEDFGVVPEPSMPRPTGFNEPMLPEPGPRPTTGKKLQQRQRRWDQQNQQYQEQQGRLQEYNSQNAEAEKAWQAYDAPEQVEARTRYNDAKANYNMHEPEYKKAYDQYRQAYNQYSSDYDAALARYNEQQRAAFPNTEEYTNWSTQNRAWTDYEASPEYQAWLARRQWPKNAWQFVRNHKLGVGLGAWWLGDKLFGGESTPAPTQNPATPAPSVRPDTIGIIPGINVDSLRQTVIDSLTNYFRYPNNAPELVEEEDEGNN